MARVASPDSAASGSMASKTVRPEVMVGMAVPEVTEVPVHQAWVVSVLALPAERTPSSRRAIHRFLQGKQESQGPASRPRLRSKFVASSY